jgi:hypothetical protein
MTISSNWRVQLLVQKLMVKALKKKRSKEIFVAAEKRARCRNVEKNRHYAFETIRKIEFERMFRMPRVSFSKLLKKVEPKLQKDIKYAKNSSQSPPVTPTTELLATRWLAGGSYLDIASFFGLSSACVFHSRYFTFFGRA